MTQSDNLFWRFSLSLYRRPGVAAACLELQDRRNLDVNLLLFALWRGMAGERLTSARLTTLDLLMADWRDRSVRPLRNIRRDLKPLLERLGPHRAAAEALRAEIAAAELRAEQIEQAMLFDQAGPPAEESAGIALALANLDQLLGMLAAPDPSLDDAARSAIAAALRTDL
jgi:uncharacterized protein (TIGR02444 family)